MSRDVLHGFLSVFSSKVGGLLLTLLITPLLVRALGSAQYGDYAFIMSILGLTMIIVNAGIFDGTRKFIAEDRPETHWLENVVGYYFRLGILFALIGAICFVGFALSGFSTRYLGPEFELYFIMVAAIVIFRQLYSVARGGLMGLGLEHYSEPLTIVLRKVLYGSIGLSLAFAGYGVFGMLTGHIIASGVITVIAVALLSRRTSIAAIVKKTPSDFPRRELLSFNSLTVVFVLLTFSMYHVDILLLWLIVGSEQTGYYNAALNIAEFIWFVPLAIEIVLLHSTSELWANEETKRVTSIVSKITRYTAAFSTLLVLGVAALADAFVPLYFGADFEPAVIPLLLLLPGVLGFAVVRPVYSTIQGKGDMKILIVATGCAAGLNLGLNLLLIPRYGMHGAAIATSIGYGSMLVFHVAAARRVGFDPLEDIRAGPIGVTGLLSAVVIFGLASIISSSVISLTVVPAVGLFTFSVIGFKLGVFDRGEVRELMRRLPVSISGQGQ